MAKIIVIGFAALLAIGAAVFFYVLPARVDARVNMVLPHDPYEVSAEAQRLHETLRVADLHADTLLWMRNPARRHQRGETDLPRLQAGGYRLQVFTAVTKAPRDMKLRGNDADSDRITLLMIAQRWPVRTWGSLAERALYQASRLERLQADGGGAFKFVKTKNDLQSAMASGALAGVMGAEGAHPLEGKIENLDRLYDAGYRVLGLQHFFDNELGGSLHGISGEGLTAFGRKAVAAAAAKSMIIDVAHSSENVVRDVLALIDRPVIVSHTGFQGQCDSPRNISDDLMRQVAAAGGLVGVGFWESAVCDATPAGIAAAIVYGVDLLGAEHVALGSDFDGAVKTRLDATEIAAVTQALLDAGVDAQTIRLVMGENAIRFFMENLPD